MIVLDGNHQIPHRIWNRFKRTAGWQLNLKNAMDCLPVLFFASPKMPETFLILCSQILLPYFLHLYHLYLSLHCEIPHQVLTFARDFMGFQYETAGARRFDLGCLVHLVRIQVTGSPGHRAAGRQMPSQVSELRSSSFWRERNDAQMLWLLCMLCICLYYLYTILYSIYVCLYLYMSVLLYACLYV